MLAQRGMRARGGCVGAAAAAARCRRPLLAAAFAPVSSLSSASSSPPPPAVPPTWTAPSSDPPPPAITPLPPALLPLGAALDAALDRYWRASPTARAVVDAMWRRRYGEPPVRGGGGGGGGGPTADAKQRNTTTANALAPLRHDHLAFRTFGVPGHGVAALGAALRAWGYVPHDEGGRLNFPKKKLRAAWFAPPPGLEGCLPRVFVSELRAEELSPRAAAIVRRYAGTPPAAPPPASPLELQGLVAASSASASPAPSSHQQRKHGDAADGLGEPPWLAAAAARAWTAVAAGGLPWTQSPSRRDWEALAAESEYAAWVLAHGYSVNHAALSLHGLKRREAAREARGLSAPPPSDDPRGERSSLAAFADELSAEGFALNGGAGGGVDAGPVIKASPGDGGLLLQCSTLADAVEYAFAGEGGEEGGGDATGLLASIPGAYLEFVERRPLPRFAQVPWRELKEWQRRDGFEQASADGIFASTSLRQRGDTAAAGGGGGQGGAGGAGDGGAGGGGGFGMAGGVGHAPAVIEDAALPARALPKAAGASSSGA